MAIHIVQFYPFRSIHKIKMTNQTIMLMKKTLQILFIFLVAVGQGAMVWGQNPDIKRTMHWYFGEGAGLDFTS